MYISGRNDGFVARTYLVTGDKVPDDGLFLRKKKGKAVVEDTTFARSIGYVNGMECDASSPVPERLKLIFTQTRDIPTTTLFSKATQAPTR